MELLGQRFGNIRVTGVVGEGGMGAVYAAFDETLERKVALKVVHEELRLDSEARERLLREARSLSKLDHPNICRIHDYIHTSDSDLLVLEYIDGRTLTDVIRDKRTRAEKLRIAIAVAEVLVSAHRAGILHRDLKPDNVMLTKSDEVKVLDFGLARWLTRAKASIAPGSDERIRIVGDTRLPSGALETQAGIAMGTPMYMSPEQARGEELTPASDMYAFGLLLQVLFTGQEPHPDFLGSREVMLRVARNETNPVHDAARDIAALIERLKQKAPADRPTAVETLEKLRWLAAKPARVTRRSIAAAIVLMIVLGAWRYTVDLKQERAVAVAAEARAVAARADAEHRRDQADELIEFMIGDLRNKLEPVGRLDILDDVGNRTLAYIDSLDAATVTAPELVRNAKAVNQLGSVRVDQGKSPEAMELFRRSAVLTSAALKREPRNSEALLVHGETQYWLGNGLRLLGRYDEALVHMREYMKAGDALAAIDPKNDKFQLERAYGHSGVGFILEAKGNLKEAADHYRVSLEVKQLLADRAPGDAKAQAELARAFNKMGVNLYGQANLQASNEYLRRENAIYRKLVALEPQQMLWKQRLAFNMGYLSRGLEATGRDDEALALLREELAIENELAARDPANVEWQRAAAMTMTALGGGLAREGDLAEAVPLLAAAASKIATARQLAPTRTSFGMDAAYIDSEYGRALSAQQDPRAVAVLERALRTAEKHRGTPGADVQLGRAGLYLGDALARSRPAAAIAAWQRAVRELPPVAQADDVDELKLWADVLLRLDRQSEANDVIARLQLSGYATDELTMNQSKR
ncbi:MAG TPA: serine/threonine-protein kinase [Thermoanaerobaculia bacterium]|nr:serine/threonine-protein kinase [Thermoanaerobaculia bacterium]